MPNTGVCLRYDLGRIHDQADSMEKDGEKGDDENQGDCMDNIYRTTPGS